MATTIIQVKRGYAKYWVQYNPVLLVGEPGLEVDTGKIKFGNGKDPWIKLPYAGEGTNVISADTHDRFPLIGKPECIYKANLEKQVYQWNAETRTYEVLGGGNPFDITIIDGGNANG